MATISNRVDPFCECLNCKVGWACPFSDEGPQILREDESTQEPIVYEYNHHKDCTRVYCDESSDEEIECTIINEGSPATPEDLCLPNTPCLDTSLPPPPLQTTSIFPPYATVVLPIEQWSLAINSNLVQTINEIRTVKMLNEECMARIKQQERAIIKLNETAKQEAIVLQHVVRSERFKYEDFPHLHFHLERCLANLPD